MNEIGKVLGIIPARGGSKGVPRKNIRLLGGKPLLQYTAEAALSARLLSRVMLSSEDPEIIETGRKCGLDVPFVRPLDLAQDDTPTIKVVQNVLQWYKANGEQFSAVCLLQPTSPFRTSETIDACIKLFFEADADSVVTILPVPIEFNPHWVYFKDENGVLKLSTGDSETITRRQMLPPAFHRAGSVYVTNTKVIEHDASLYGKKMLGYLVDKTECVNIDTQADWDLAEERLSRRIS